jgi:hypothetical protein
MYTNQQFKSIQDDIIEGTERNGCVYATKGFITYLNAVDIAKQGNILLYEYPLKYTFCTREYAAKYIDKKKEPEYLF